MSLLFILTMCVCGGGGGEECILYVCVCVGGGGEECVLYVCMCMKCINT